MSLAEAELAAEILHQRAGFASRRKTTVGSSEKRFSRPRVGDWDWTSKPSCYSKAGDVGLTPAAYAKQLK
jgi:hypothetical protein